MSDKEKLYEIFKKTYFKNRKDSPLVYSFLEQFSDYALEDLVSQLVAAGVTVKKANRSVSLIDGHIEE